MPKFLFWLLLNLCLLQEILEVIEEHNPQLVQFILDNKADFLRLVLDQPQEHQDDDVLHFQSNEPNNGGERY